MRVELENPIVEGRRRLFHRIFADGLVHLDAPEVLSVPRSAVIETGPDAIAYVDQGGGAFERRTLGLGRRGDQFIETLSGVTEGEKVVTNGTLLIDSQAEMNRSLAGPAETERAIPAPMTDAEKRAVSDFVIVADAMAKALSSDDLAAFNKAAEGAAKSTETLITALKSRRDLADELAALDEARHFERSVDLQKAREAFHKFTIAATGVLEPLRVAEGAPEFAVWECGMVDQAIHWRSQNRPLGSDRWPRRPQSIFRNGNAGVCRSREAAPSPMIPKHHRMESCGTAFSFCAGRCC